MKISIFTPTHNPKFILEAYESLKSQTLQDWEWIIYINNTDENIFIDDKRVKIYKQEINKKLNIGKLKKIAASFCSGDILVELDHDDILTPQALEKVKETFESNENIVMVYSNNSIMNFYQEPIFMMNNSELMPVMTYKYKDKLYYYFKTLKQDPHTICIGFLNPNHLRAYRKSIYDMVGGYDENDEVCEDVNLNVKMFFKGDLYYIDDVLYIQRMYNEDFGKLKNYSSNDWYRNELMKINKKRYLEIILTAINYWKSKGKMTNEIYDEIIIYLVQYFSNI